MNHWSAERPANAWAIEGRAPSYAVVMKEELQNTSQTILYVADPRLVAGSKGFAERIQRVEARHEVKVAELDNRIVRLQADMRAAEASHEAKVAELSCQIVKLQTEAECRSEAHAKEVDALRRQLKAQKAKHLASAESHAASIVSKDREVATIRDQRDKLSANMERMKVTMKEKFDRELCELRQKLEAETLQNKRLVSKIGDGKAKIAELATEMQQLQGKFCTLQIEKSMERDVRNELNKANELRQADKRAHEEKLHYLQKAYDHDVGKYQEGLTKTSEALERSLAHNKLFKEKLLEMKAKVTMAQTETDRKLVPFIQVAHGAVNLIEKKTRNRTTEEQGVLDCLRKFTAQIDSVMALNRAEAAVQSSTEVLHSFSVDDTGDCTRGPAKTDAH